MKQEVAADRDRRDRQVGQRVAASATTGARGRTSGRNQSRGGRDLVLTVAQESQAASWLVATSRIGSQTGRGKNLPRRKLWLPRRLPPSFSVRAMTDNRGNPPDARPTPWRPGGRHGGPTDSVADSWRAGRLGSAVIAPPPAPGRPRLLKCRRRRHDHSRGPGAGEPALRQPGIGRRGQVKRATSGRGPRMPRGSP